MVRVIPICVALERAQVQRLASVEARLGASRSALVRRAIETLLARFEMAPERDEERAAVAG